MTRTARPVTVTVYPDGPLLVRGDAQIVDEQGRPVPRRRAAVALCRCGASATKPFCDGSHKVVGFTSGPTTPSRHPVPSPGPGLSGGTPPGRTRRSG